MNENINLCKILKDCPKGTKFYSYIHGEVKFDSIDKSLSYPILVEAKTKTGYIRTKTFSKEGIFDDGFNGTCTLVPSLEQPDWSKWKCPKPKFDPKTLRAFDKVLIRPTKDFCWNISLFSYISPYPIKTSISTISGECDFCIPYNKDTKHLLGTNYDAPEYYRYWEK